MTNAAVFIDGSNFYNGLKDLGIRNTTVEVEKIRR